MLGALALVVAVNGALLAAVAWIGSRALSASGRSVSVELGLPLSVGAVLLGANAIVLGLFSRAREYAADRGASRLTGNPAALASALETLGDGSRPVEDARVHASATLGIVPQPLGLEDVTEDEEESWVERYLSPVSLERIGEPALFDRVVTGIGGWLRERLVAPTVAAVRRLLGWRPATHPPTATRVERLRVLERRRRE